MAPATKTRVGSSFRALGRREAGPRAASRRNPWSSSHRPVFGSHCYDRSRRRNVTDERGRLAGGAVRREPAPPAGGGLPDARLTRGGGGRRAGSLAPSQPLGGKRDREPGGMADHSRGACVPDHAAVAPVPARGALDAHVPDPIVSTEERLDPEQEALLADSVGLALLVVLETLDPAERLAFVLHDMFDVPFDEIATIVERSPAAARQLASRARRRVKGAALVPDADLARQREAVGAFLAAAREGDFGALLEVLDPDVVLRADVGAVPAGASRVIRGAPAVAEQALAYARRLGPVARPALVNGAAGIVAAPGGQPISVLGFTVTGGRIVEIDILADPKRLSGSTLRSSRRNEVERRGSRPKEERWQRWLS